MRGLVTHIKKFRINGAAAGLFLGLIVFDVGLRDRRKSILSLKTGSEKIQQPLFVINILLYLKVFKNV